MSSPNSDCLSPSSSGDASPELYDATESLDDEDGREGSDTEIDGERRHYSPPTYTFSSSFTSRWTQPWSKTTKISRSSHVCEWSDNGPSVGPAQKFEGLGTNLALSTWPYQSNIKRPTVGAGMENLGNTCFMNSVLQCFVHTVPVLRGILSDGHLIHSNCEREGFCLLCALGDLTASSLTNTIVSPHNLADNLSYISSSFRRFQQEDAHEFLQCFLDRLENCDDSSLQRVNMVKHVFGGRVVSNLKCCNCGHCSDTYEPSIDLSLEIEDADNLLIALQSFTKVERIEDPDTKFTCEECKEQVSVEKKLSFDQAPSVAVFHLKRFKNDGCFVQKIDKHVAFPLDLDLLPFTGSNMKSETEPLQTELRYVLYAVVVHVGLTSTSGHYYCFIRISPNTWCKFDDSRVVLVDEDFVLSQDAYILFYAKESTPWFTSFIESQKEFFHSTIWNTSPKSVLDNLTTSPASPSLENTDALHPNVVSHGFGSEHSKDDNNEIRHSGPMQNEMDSRGKARDLPEVSAEIKCGPTQNKMESRGRTHNLPELSPTVALRSSATPDVSFPAVQKISPISLDKAIKNHSSTTPDVSFTVVQKLSPHLLDKAIKNQEHELPYCEIDIYDAMRSPSPEIYREDPPDAHFSVPRRHLRSLERVSCKRRLEEDMNEIKHARTFIKKTMHSSRGQQLLAAMGAPKNEASVNIKKSRRLGIV